MSHTKEIGDKKYDIVEVDTCDLCDLDYQECLGQCGHYDTVYLKEIKDEEK